MANILITEHIDPVGISLLEEAGHHVIMMETREQSEMVEKLKDADAVLVRILEIPAEVIACAPKLKMISKHGVGVDNIDLKAAAEAGITVTITPGANSLSVAEHTFALLLALAKNLQHVVSRYREIGFAAKNCAPGIEVTGKTLGIIGCGRIGAKIAAMAHLGFGMKVLAYDPYLTSAPEGVELTSERDRVFHESDFVTLHCMLNEETRRSVGKREFDLMKKGAIFLNCARGPIVDEQALIEALQSGKLGGAGLDATEKEPCDPDSPLFKMDNVLLTPHYAPTTTEAAVAVSRIAAENVIHYFANEPIVGRLV